MRTASTAGYGRYPDAPDLVYCPGAKSKTTPCVARDGAQAQTNGVTRNGERIPICNGCWESPANLFKAFVKVVTEP